MYLPCQARGQAWALYGFGTAYTFTQDARFLKTAEACADYYIERTPAHGVPPNDWDEPSSPLSYESSAAAIAASGLWKLAKLTGDRLQEAYPALRPYTRSFSMTVNRANVDMQTELHDSDEVACVPRVCGG